MSSGIVDWDRFEHVLESLGVLARLTENKKLTLRAGNLDIDNDKKLQFLLRWWNSDDHDGCLDSIRQTASEAIHMSRACLNEIIYGNKPSSHQVGGGFIEKQRSLRRFGRLTEALECASHGIETQKVTYKNDDQFCARVDVLIGNIRDELHDMDITLKLASGSGGGDHAAKDTSKAAAPTKPASFHSYAAAASYQPATNSSDDDEDAINLEF